MPKCNFGIKLLGFWKNYIFLDLYLKYVLADNYTFKVNNKNNSTRFEICSKLTIKTLEQRHWRQIYLRTQNYNFSKFVIWGTG